MTEKHLIIPLSEKVVRDLQLGEIVFLDGPVYTGRSLFHSRAVEQNIVPPLDFNRMNVLLHAGPMMERTKDSWKPLSMTLTASIRFEKYGPAIIRKLGIRAIVGKTTMGQATMDVMKTFGAVHLTAVGIMTNLLPEKVRTVEQVYFIEELGGTEATWVIDLEEGGPFIVDIDARGNNLFQQSYREVEKKFKEIQKKLGIPKGFRYTHVSG